MDARVVIASSRRLRGNLIKYPEIASSIAMQFPRNDVYPFEPHNKLYL
ncbi:hypothetical protein REIS_2015 [Rickettsia endosymbiont of Ixodes scapularis]|nr:hypothetical protein REIS_2015 [Rickettsia endosymbiont of Ixodes scapularis]